MMSGDCQSQRLAEWLQTLGWDENIKQSDLKKLNTPKMRSVWRHLQAQVMPVNVASTIRKNVLLNRLEKENLYVGQFQNFTLDSVNQLRKVKEILKTEEEIEAIKDEIKVVDANLQNEKCSLLKKKAVKELERNQLNEIEAKTMILDLKLAKFSKDLKKCNSDKETAETLKISKTPYSYSELNHQKHIVSNYVKNYEYSLNDTDDDSEYMCEMMSSVLEFKPNTVLSGILRITKEALKSLHAKVDILEDVTSNNIVTFKEKLTGLKVMVVKNEKKILEGQEKKILNSDELLKEKGELMKVFTDMYRGYIEALESSETESIKENHQLQKTTEIEDEDSHRIDLASQLLDNLIEKIKKERKEKKIIEEKNALMQDTDFKLLNNVRRSVVSLSVQVNDAWKDVEKKINEFNMVTSRVFASELDSGELNELVSEITQVADEFKVESSEAQKGFVIDSNKFTDIILKEIEVFQRIPMVALQRKWDTSNEMLQISSTRRFSNDPSLLLFLNQSEEKNIIINVIEKYLWSLYICPQIH